MPFESQPPGRMSSFVKVQEPDQKEVGGLRNLGLGIFESSKPNLRPKNRVQTKQPQQKGSGFGPPSEILVSQLSKSKERFLKPLMGPGVLEEQEEKVEGEEPRTSQSSALDREARSLAHRGAPDLSSDTKGPPAQTKRKTPGVLGKTQSEVGEEDSQQLPKDPKEEAELGDKRQIRAPLERTERHPTLEVLPEKGEGSRAKRIRRTLEATKEGGVKETETREEVIKSLPTHKKSLRTVQRRISHPDTPLEMTTHTFRLSNGGKRIQRSERNERSLQKVVPDVP